MASGVTYMRFGIMTDVVCNICEEVVGEVETVDEIGDLPEVALCNGGYTGDIEGATVVCNGCVKYGYELMMWIEDE